jgi:hypothetical protein
LREGDVVVQPCSAARNSWSLVRNVAYAVCCCWRTNWLWARVPSARTV